MSQEQQLPDWYALMLPILRAVESQGGRARNEEIDQAAAVILDLTTEQMALEYPPPSTKGSKMRDRMAWSRSLLRRLGALESVSRGTWALTAKGSNYLRLSGPSAELALRTDADSNLAQKEPSAGEIEDFRSEAHANKPRRLTVRQLMALWGAGRRSATTNDRILRTLTLHGLRTDPDFMTTGMAEEVAIVRLGPEGPSKVASNRPERLTIGALPSATAGIVSITPQDSLEKALSLMVLNDFSQLAIPRRHGSPGAVSWESIARARLRTPDAQLRDCILEAAVVPYNKALLDVVPDIVRAGFVLVRAIDNSISGIVTTADLSEQFASATRPFLILSEIEVALRHAVDRAFTAEELRGQLDPNDLDRDVRGAHSLTLGEVGRLLSPEEVWRRLGWWVDRSLFLREFDAIRLVRNEVMHFSPDPLDPADIARLETFHNLMTALVFD